MTACAATGCLRMRAAVAGGRTVLSEVFRTAPFHPGPVHYRGALAEVILQGVGPGLFSGEALEVDVAVEPGAALAVSGQGATKIYPSRDDRVAVAETTLHVGPGATLWWLPGELIPFHDANLLARTMIRLDEGARIALLEIVTPGRTAMDERFAYRRLDLRLRIDSCGKPLFVERAVLDPQSRPAARVGSLGPFCCSGTLILAGYDNVPAISRYDDDLWLAAGGGNGLALVRGIGRAAAPLRAALLDVLRQAAASAGSGAHAGGAGVKA